MDGHVAVFSRREALEFGWQRTLANAKPLLALGLVNAVLAMVSRGLTEGRGTLLASLVVQVAQAAVGMAFLRVLLKLHDGQPIDLRRVSQLLQGFATYLLTSLLLGLLIALGFVLLIVPGVWWALRYGFAPMLVVDRGLEPAQAFRESRRLTEGVKGELLAFAALACGVNLLGALALGVGVLLTVPTTGLAAVFILRRLQARAVAAPSLDQTSGGSLPPLAPAH